MMMQSKARLVPGHISAVLALVTADGRTCECCMLLVWHGRTGTGGTYRSKMQRYRCSCLESTYPTAWRSGDRQNTAQT